MDIVTKSHLDQFVQQYGYKSCTEEEAFEKFCIYCVASKYIRSETINKSLLDDLNIGKGGDWGIDGVIVIANGRIVTSQQEIDDLLFVNNSLNINFILVQAKTSLQFKVAELGQTLDGAEYILKDVNGCVDLPKSNESLTEYRDLVKYAYSKSAYFERGENPMLDVYYVTCGDYNENPDYTAKIDKTKDAISRLNLIRDFSCHMIGKKEIISFYKDTKFKIEVDIKVEHKIALPEIPNIEESYLCLIPFREYRKLIISDKRMIQSVFYDNIRAFQGENTVNKAMADTLKEGNINLFVAMNNGITVITKSLKVTGSNMHLVDYQIVNGCQTSNVLQQNQDLLNIDDLMLTVKIISSKNKDVRDKIIVGNNSQTEVKREQLIALLDTQKQIEDYYNAQNKFEKLYYERRSKQYRLEENIVPPYKVITIPFQIKAYVSMIMGEPHLVRGYYGSIVERFDKNGIKVFAPETHPALYYTSALACYRMTEFFSQNKIDRKYKKIKFHLLLAFRLMCENTELPKNNRDNKIQQYCDYLCALLNDKDVCQQRFYLAIELINIALNRSPIDADGQSKELTEKMFKIAKKVNEIQKNKCSQLDAE